MTLAEPSPAAGAIENGSFTMIDFSAPQRDKPMVHPALDPPVCEACQKNELQFFDTECAGCREMLVHANTTVPEIFAILRQWTSQTQQNLEMLVREILKRGAHINDRDGLTDMTLLQYAAKSGAQGVGDVDEACRVVKLLLSKNADLFIRCRWTNMTALHYATYFDVAPVIVLLLKASKAKDIDSPCEQFDHGTPLHVSATNLAASSATVLLQNGADPHAKDDLGRTPCDCVPDPNAFDQETEIGKLVSKIKKIFQDAMVSSPAVNRKDDSEAKAILQNLGLHLGEKVMVGGVKMGMLRFCGPTDFASGIWAGIELDEPAGKNDGSVAGIYYFRCPPKYGIFAPVGKIAKPGILMNGSRPYTATPTRVSYGRVDTSHVTAKVDTDSQPPSPSERPEKGLSRGNRSLVSAEPLEDLQIGDKVIVAGQRKGTIAFSGETDFAPGWWYGVTLDRAVGKNDGRVNDRQYFTCKPKHGVFAPPSRIQRIADLNGSRESLEDLSATATDKQRRLSVGSTGSQQSSQSVNSRKALTNSFAELSRLGIITERRVLGSRPKSSGTVGLRRSFVSPNPVPSGELKLQEGMSVFCNNELGILRYIGNVDFAEGTWLGVELRSPRGKNDGSVQGQRYFTCRPSHGLLVRPSKVTVRGINSAKLLGEQNKD